jgi:hypothetical protein
MGLLLIPIRVMVVQEFYLMLTMTKSGGFITEIKLLLVAGTHYELPTTTKVVDNT